MPTFSSIAPCFAVADVGATMRWYREELGFSSDPFPESEPHVFAILFLNQVEIMLQRVEGHQKLELYSQRRGGVWDAYIRMENVREFFEAIKERVTILQPLKQQPYGAWQFEVRDLNGYVLVFSEAG